MPSRSHTEWGDQAEDGAQEDSATSTKEVVERIRYPTSKEGNSDIRRGVDEADDPGVLVTSTSRSADRTRIWNPEILWKPQIRTIRACLIPSLNGSRDRIEDDSKVQDSRVFPTIGKFSAEMATFSLIEVRKRLKQVR